MNIPHNEQKHNTNQLTLQHIGSLAYHKGKTATSYDSVNSLTTPNNQYTLLYPDLVQELFDFALHNNNSVKNNVLFYGGLGVNNIKSSPSDYSLSPRDILFFLQIISLYQLELNKGNSSITYPSLKLAKLLGVDASCDTTHLTANTHNSVNSLTNANKRATILKMTAKLEDLGLLKVFRRKRKNGMDLANKLIPVLPDRLHAKLKDLPANLKVSDSFKLVSESNLEHILRTKLFVPIELEFMKSLFKNNLPSKYKLFFLNCIMSAYRSFRQNFSNSDILSFSATSLELTKKNNISKRTLFSIFRYIKQQGDSFFLKVEHKYTKSDDIDSNRYDKSIFVISINPLVFPISQIKQSQTEEITNCNYDELQDDVLSIFPDTYKEFATGVQKKQPSSAKKTALNNKEEIIKKKYSKNIDYIDVKSEKEFLENEQSSFPSESYNNSSFLNNSCKRTLLEQHDEQAETTVRSTNKEILRKGEQQKEQHTKRIELARSDLTYDKAQGLEIRHFYPLSDKDINLLNSRANREFSNNFVNQLLLKLYIKYPEKRFKNKFTFLSYMIQILANEKHQGPLVNHTSFRFNCNINAAEKNLLEQEKYLNQIEDSLDTSKEMQLKKKIAGRFSTEIAYKILTKVEFKTNHDNSFITVIIPNRLELGSVRTERLSNRQQKALNEKQAENSSNRQTATLNKAQTVALSKQQIKILHEQLEAVYGINGYYVEEVEQEEQIADVTSENVEDTERVRWKGERQEEIGKLYSKIKESDIITNSEDIGILDIGMELDKIEEKTVWGQIRKGLKEELVAAVDEAWFSKAVATEDKENGTLTLTMPTRFMSDWVRNNYAHVIRRLSEGCWIEKVEYCCE